MAKLTLATLYEHPSNGSVPSVTSCPFGTPSPSQSASIQACVGATVTCAKIKSQGSFGSVSPASTFPSSLASSVPSNTPSPSVSGFNGSVVVVLSTSGTNTPKSVSGVSAVVNPCSVPSWIPSVSVSTLFGSVSLASTCPSPFASSVLSISPSSSLS